MNALQMNPSSCLGSLPNRRLDPEGGGGAGPEDWEERHQVWPQQPGGAQRQGVAQCYQDPEQGGHQPVLGEMVTVKYLVKCIISP